MTKETEQEIYNKATVLIDESNSMDPNFENENEKDIGEAISEFKGKLWPKELLYSNRMSRELLKYKPNASLALQLAARSQHICRWMIPRSKYDMDRVGYLKWRTELYNFHAEKIKNILERVQAPQDVIYEVCRLVQKKDLKRNSESQTLEDVICIVFLVYYFEIFSQKHSRDKIQNILKKTLFKMSEAGVEYVKGLDLSLSVKDYLDSIRTSNNLS